MNLIYYGKQGRHFDSSHFGLTTRVSLVLARCARIIRRGRSGWRVIAAAVESSADPGLPDDEVQCR